MLNTFLSLLAYVWILQSIFTAKLSTYSLRKKIYTLWYQLIPTPPTRSSNIFLKFCYSAWSKTFLKGIYVLSILYKQLLYSFHLFAILDYPLDWFSTIR